MSPPRKDPVMAYTAALLEGLPVGVAIRGGAELKGKGYERKTFSLSNPPTFGPAEEPWLNVAGFLLFWHSQPPEFIRFENNTIRTIPEGESLPWSVRTLPSSSTKGNPDAGA